MRRALALMCCLLLPVAVLAADAEPEPENDRKTILGTWKIIKATKGGEVPDADMLKSQFTFGSDKISVTRPGGGEDPAGYKIDPKKMPKEIDIKPMNGADLVIRGIYKFEKGQLFLHFNKPGSVRPKNFEEKTDITLQLQRVKEEDTRRFKE